jgi:hypothetical protein
MPKIEIKFGPPIPDPHTFQNHTATLTGDERAILSLRGFACAASMMVPSYHLWLAATEAKETTDNVSDYPSLVICTYMRESMLDHLLVQIRRIYDPDPRSLAAGTIACLLEDSKIRKFLVDRAIGAAHAGSPFDPQWAEDHLSLVRERCSLGLVTQIQDLPIDASLFQIQAYLARRVANKRSAHITLDDYGITKSDIRDICFSTLIIARAVHRVHGDDVYSGSYVDVDWGSFEAATRIIGHRHTAGLLARDLDSNIDMLVSRIHSNRAIETSA